MRTDTKNSYHESINKAIAFIESNSTTDIQLKDIALKGKEDYVPTPPKIETVIVDGGHISPLEEPLKVQVLIQTLIDTKGE